MDIKPKKMYLFAQNNQVIINIFLYCLELIRNRVEGL